MLISKVNWKSLLIKESIWKCPLRDGTLKEKMCGRWETPSIAKQPWTSRLLALIKILAACESICPMPGQEAEVWMEEKDFLKCFQHLRFPQSGISGPRFKGA